MKRLLSIGSLLLCILSMNAQNTVILQQSGTVKAYGGTSALSSAYAASNNGDTIYLGNGFWPDIDISKKLTILGPGIFRDSGKAIGRCGINGSVKLLAGSSGSSFQGFEILGTLNIGYNDSVEQISIRRMHIVGAVYCGQYTSKGLVTNVNLSENVIESGVNGFNRCKNFLINNNVISGKVEGFDGVLVLENNYLKYSHPYDVVLSVNNCLIQNNIFAYDQSCCYGILNGTGNKFYKNSVGFKVGLHSTTDTSGIFWGIKSDSIMIKPLLNFNAGADYHMKNNWKSTLKGTDGSEIGIYGGKYTTVKEGWIPIIPHYQSVQIDPKTDNTGKLGIKIKIQAQNR